MPRELVDVVDENDDVIRVTTRDEVRRLRLLHRSVFVVVVRPTEQLLVHKRSPDKDLWPSLWDIAVGGVVSSGESYEEAARRELAEEVGITDAEPKFLGAGRYLDEDVALLARCYYVTFTGEVRLVDGEVSLVRWLAWTELDGFLAREQVVPDSKALLLPLLGLIHDPAANV